MWMRVAIQITVLIWTVLKKPTITCLANILHMLHPHYSILVSRPQLSSCYLIAMEDDSIDGIYNTLAHCARISKWAGGIGLHIHNIRASGTHIRGTNGTSNGIIPMLKVFNNTARYVDQGGGSAMALAIYLEPCTQILRTFCRLKRITATKKCVPETSSMLCGS